METCYDRQKDKKAIKYIKGYTHCANSELILTYFCVAFSLLFSIAGIALTFFTVLQNFPDVSVMTPEQQSLSDSLSLTKNLISVISGFYLVLQIFLLYLAEEFGKNKVTVLELYDTFVYDLKPNPMIMRPIKEPQIHEWAEHITKIKPELRNFYFKEQFKDKNKEETIFKNQEKIAHKYYGLLSYAMSHFYFIIWAVILAVILFFMVFIGLQMYFVDVMIFIFIPSLSIISMIANSFKKYIVQRKAALSCISAIDDLKKSKEKVTYTNVRNLQDGLFAQRIALMNIPNFVSKAYDRKTEKWEKIEEKNRAEIEASNKRPKKVELARAPTKTVKLTETKATLSKEQSKPASSKVEKPNNNVKSTNRADTKPKDENKAANKTATKIKETSVLPKSNKVGETKTGVETKK